MNTKGKFTLEEATNSTGDMVPAYGFDFNKFFIVNAKVSECGRFAVDPAYYGLTQAEVDELEALNKGRDLI